MPYGLRGMKLQEKKKHKKITAYRKPVQKDPTVKRCLLILNLKPLRLHVKGREFHRQKFCRHRIPEPRCARKETVDIDILAASRNCDRKIMQSIRITSRPTLRKRKWNQLRQF